MEQSGPPTLPPGLEPLPPELEQYLDAHGIEHDAFGALSGPYSPAGTLLLASPDTTILAARRRPGTHPEAPVIEWAIEIQVRPDARLCARVVRNPQLGIDVISGCDAGENWPFLAISDATDADRRRLWAAYIRWHDIFTAQQRDVERPYDEHRVSAERERAQLYDDVVRRVRHVSETLEAIAQK
jgi:hypothetical protein